MVWWCGVREVLMVWWCGVREGLDGGVEEWNERGWGSGVREGG